MIVQLFPFLLNQLMHSNTIYLTINQAIIYDACCGAFLFKQL
jgi:hypothetical protein